MASESQAMATAIGQASPLPSLLLDFVLYVPVPISHSSSSIAPPPTVPVAVPLTIGPVPPPSPVPPTIAPVPPPSPVQPSTTPPLLTYHHRPPPSSGPANSRPTPDPANTTDLSPLNQPIALRKIQVLLGMAVAIWSFIYLETFEPPVPPARSARGQGCSRDQGVARTTVREAPIDPPVAPA
uniref:WAS/WASL-interacting protein family member 3-like n=1 Tax=Nicotiana tabacum TaxID=4097 RepID=A0A1S4CR19_TOBAC|nr:PREDICTED: WAS/WASL-interacting protein family member 3-like [Nicotiana tabacum]